MSKENNSKDEKKQDDASQPKSLDARIRELELEKLKLKEKIEDLLAVMAEESGVRSIKKRKFDVGYAPNDWIEEENS